MVRGRSVSPVAKSLAACREETAEQAADPQFFPKRETRLPIGVTNRIKEKNL